MACAQNLPYLNCLAAYKLIALWTSGCKSILCNDCIIYATFLLGCHYFSPTIYLQISPSLTLGCHIWVLNLIIGNLNGNCSGKSKSTNKSYPSYGDPIGPLITTSQWNKFYFYLHLADTLLNKKLITFCPCYLLLLILSLISSYVFKNINI